MALLKQLRKKLGFTPDEVAAAAGWSRARLAEIERVDDMDDHEATRLSDLYGVEIEEYVCNPGEVSDRQPVAALLKSQSDTLPAGCRFAVAEATTVARALRELQRMLDVPTGWGAVSAFRESSDYRHPRDGAPEALARVVRQRLGLGELPIASFQRQVLEPLGCVVLWERLPRHIDAFSFASEEVAAVIVANLDGQHMGGALGRRMTFAHELCHLLFDRTEMRGIGSFCEVATRGPARGARTRAEKIEQRARAFGAWLLAPRSAVQDLWKETAASPIEARVREVMVRFGMGYEATRAHLKNLDLLELSVEIPRVDWSTPPSWEEADPMPALASSVLRSGVSPLRAGVFLDHLLLAWKADLVSEPYVKGHLRADFPTWQKLRRALGFPTRGTWRTSSALLPDL